MDGDARHVVERQIEMAARREPFLREEQQAVPDMRLEPAAIEHSTSRRPVGIDRAAAVTWLAMHAPRVDRLFQRGYGRQSAT
jgi:hypothetical protein